VVSTGRREASGDNLIYLKRLARITLALNLVENLNRCAGPLMSVVNCIDLAVNLVLDPPGLR
jgi:hypothetical protein